MRKIHLLDNDTINKIAAGEVIENPRSIVKELTENSIDANSDEITIEVKNGGKSLIRITDNGIGIEKSEIEDAFKRHCTSKISSSDDLNSLLTLGFRGEALASIAAVSNVEIISKTKNDESGIKLVIRGGETLLKEDIGCPVGTTISITDLFYNVPARKKFLKSDLSESTNINEIVTCLALSKEHISFKYINNGNILFKTPKTEHLINTISSLYDKELYTNLLDVNYIGDIITVKGYTTNLNYYRGNRKYQIVFINGRIVKHKRLGFFLDAAYNTLLPKGKYPACFLKIDIPPHLVDVNVHPAKTEVRFQNEDLVLAEVKRAIYKALNNINLIKEVKKEGVVQSKNNKKTENLDITSIFDENILKKSSENQDTNFSDLYDFHKITKHFDDESIVKIDVPKNFNDKNMLKTNQSIIDDNDLTSKNKKQKNFKNETSYNQKGETSYKSKNEKINYKNLEDNIYENIVYEEINLDYENLDCKNKDSEENTNNISTIYNDKIEDKIPWKKNDANTISEKKNAIVSNINEGFVNNRKEIGNLTETKQNSFLVCDNLDESENNTENKIPQLSIIGVFMNTYIICENLKNQELYMIDQHAAHERINYENFLNEYHNQNILQQDLLIPEVINLSYEDYHIVSQYMNIYSTLGISIESFGVNSIIVTSIPVIFTDKSIKDIFYTVLDSLKNVEDINLELNKIIKNACVKSVKAGDKLHVSELNALIQKLRETKNPYTCPHGRPVIIKMTKYEIEKMFERIQN